MYFSVGETSFAFARVPARSDFLTPYWRFCLMNYTTKFRANLYEDEGSFFTNEIEWHLPVNLPRINASRGSALREEFLKRFKVVHTL